ncbi:MAG: TolC family protein [Verrucomicrobiota bacterium]|nr:TolC family protein [Verrucomicrobiota bacterium]
MSQKHQSRGVASRREFRSCAGILLFVLLLCGCSATHYRKSADKEAAKVIAEKTPMVPNMDTNFTIEATKEQALAGFPVYMETNEFFGPDSALETGSRILTLEQALGLAVRHSRTYQNSKETVYLQALALTLARHRFTPIFHANGNAAYQSRTRDVAREIDQLTGTQSSLLQQGTDTVQEHSISARSDIGVDVLLRTGARIGVDFTTDFLRFVVGDSDVFTSSRLGATISQPLLRGAGYKVNLENLTQAERDLLYELRQFTQFRKEFAVQVAGAYYQALENKDRVRNAWLGLQNFRQNVEREKAFADEGQRTQAALGQLQQAQLSTEAQWVNAVRNYQASIDQFKILIGIPVDEKIVLDDRELEALSIKHPTLAADQAVKVAIANRLDLQTAQDQFEDAGRRIGVARNQLLPDLDLILQASVDSKPGNRPLDLDFDRARWSAGIDGDLPLDRKAERNNYRATLIAYERSGRQLQLAVDQIKLEIQQGWRNLDQAKRQYEISEVGVDLSERRVQEQELLTELGRGTARDLVDARTDLINARNQRTSALVQHTIARLQFWRDLGILYIKDNGNWQEVEYAEKL